MLEDEGHLVVVLSLGKNSGALWDGSILIVNLLIALRNILLGLLNGSLNFLLDLSQLGILLLNLESLLKLVNLWELCEDRISPLDHNVNLSSIDLSLDMLVLHGVHLLLETLSLLLQVLLEGVDALLDARQL